ncbi:MAG: hypothetical protein IPN29_19460 [Saprospiraceae bacterium]|nr:hypothetical protein [Saprospiraceae bacterium]
MMKIYSFSKLISLPLILATGYFLVKLFQPGSAGSVFIFIPVVLLTVLYVFHGQIDYWWLQKNTPPLDPKIREWLVTYAPYYHNYTEELKLKFEKRLVLYTEARAFQFVGSKEMRDVPFDIKHIISSQGVRLCLGLNDFLIGDMDRIFLYKHPFPTPRFKFLHTVESDIEDGVFIFSTEQGLPGIVNPAMYYNIVLHGYVEAFIMLHPGLNYPDVSAYNWEDLEQINGINHQLILRTCGYAELNPLIIHIVCFFDHSKAYKSLFPMEYDAFCLIFGQNPLPDELRH